MRPERTARPMSALDDKRRVTSRTPGRVVAVAAACWALPYIVSKAHHAMQGRLGVHGGPAVTPEDAAEYGGAAEISAAQWGNAAVAVLIAVLVLLPLGPVTHRWNRWLRTLPVIVAAAFLAGMSLLFGMRVIAGDGGLPFTLYMIVWTALVCALIPASLSIPRPRG
ncbi:hypothetical protein [Agromyces laixinhei]|uniref:hypothetical protein n=1 Tax=Agromyces laixinhei TaxID=2585717 RepID=UPI001116A261|nr:hypothetical protein [Agromyces laixinhei]